MRYLAPRPLLLALTLIAVVGAIAFIELRLDPTRAATDAASGATSGKTGETAERAGGSAPQPRERRAPEKAAESERSADVDRTGQRDEAARIAGKEKTYERANEIASPSGFVNAEDVSITALRGEKVVLVEFWTYTCFNCQNVQPHINAWHDEYADDGLRTVGVHTPEFGFERDYDNVAAAVAEAGIEYPVVLDNGYATWNAYDNRYWPAIYLIDAEGFVRYRHFGEGAYEATEKKIRQLLAENDRTSG